MNTLETTRSDLARQELDILVALADQARMQGVAREGGSLILGAVAKTKSKLEDAEYCEYLAQFLPKIRLVSYVPKGSGEFEEVDCTVDERCKDLGNAFRDSLEDADDQSDESLKFKLTERANFAKKLQDLLTQKLFEDAVALAALEVHDTYLKSKTGDTNAQTTLAVQLELLDEFLPIDKSDVCTPKIGNQALWSTYIQFLDASDVLYGEVIKVADK